MSRVIIKLPAADMPERGLWVYEPITGPWGEYYGLMFDADLLPAELQDRAYVNDSGKVWAKSRHKIEVDPGPNGVGWLKLQLENARAMNTRADKLVFNNQPLVVHLDYCRWGDLQRRSPMLGRLNPNSIVFKPRKVIIQ